MKRAYFVAIFLLASLTIIAQNSISGTVYDATTHTPLIGATVYIMEHHKGTNTDTEGRYSIQFSSHDKVNIQFSYVGYKTQIKTIQLSKKDINMDISLQPTVFQADEIVISGGKYSTQHENAIKIETLHPNQLIGSGNTSLIKSLAEIPGVDMISKGIGVTKPTIRGLSMTNILMLNNGVRMENFQFSENHPFTVDEFGIDKVEVIKGPASLLYGSDAIGGVINITKEKAASTGTISGDYNFQYHSNTSGLVNNLGVKGATNNFHWSIRSGWKTHKDFKDGNSRVVTNSRFDEKSLKLHTGISKSFGTMELYYDLNRMLLGLTVPPAIALHLKNERKNRAWYQDLTNHVLASKNTFYISTFKTEVNLAYTANNRKLQGSELTPVKELVDMNLTNFSYETKVHYAVGQRFDFISGLQGMHKNNQNGSAPEHVLPDFSANDFSVFHLIQYHLPDRLHGQFGLRYDYRRIMIPSFSDQPDFDKKYHNISGSAGVTYNATDELLFRLNIASAYRTPNIAELTQDGLHGARYEQGNRSLISQKSYEGDFSAHLHTSKMTVDFAAFYNKINHYIFIAPTNDTTDTGHKIYRYEQNNAAIYGIETGMAYQMTSWANFKTTYAYLIAKQDNGQFLPFIPQNKLKLYLNFKKNKGLKPFVQLDAEIATKQNHPAPFETETPAYAVFNVNGGFSWQLNKQDVHINFFIKNLLDEKYIDHLSTLKPLGYYDLGRNMGVSVKIPFGVKG